MTDYVIDVEGDSLDATKLHCMVVQEVGAGVVSYTEYTEMRSFLTDLTESDRIIGHNFVRWDSPTLERILGTKTKAKIVDTLALSWYLYPKRNKHGLADWGEEFGVPKPEVVDWVSEPISVYVHRCTEDVKINTLLWERIAAFLTELYGEGAYWPLVEYLSFKMHCAALQEYNKWGLDVPEAEALFATLSERQKEALGSLEKVMPYVKTFRNIKRPKKPFKVDGTLSASGKNWNEACTKFGIDFDSDKEHKITDGFAPPKATSPAQIKNWLFNSGWKPTTFKFVPDGEDERGYSKKRAIPQIKKNDELCESVIRLIKTHPELHYLEDLGIVTHRKGLVAGLLKAEVDGFVIAAVQGLTNTLRFKHAVCVNLPSGRKPYGKEIRGLLIAREGMEICGSDMASLEDRTKQSAMMPFDPDYVAEMNVPGYDPHLDIAVEAGFLTQAQSDAYKQKDYSLDTKDYLTAQRFKGKTTNYASTYKAGAETIAREAGVPLSVGKILKEAYWSRNWSLKSIEEAQVTKKVNGMTWLLNPTSKFWYVLRSLKDIFSTLNQGTATYCFDMWVQEILKRDVKLLAQFHDEVVIEVPFGYRPGVTKYLKDCVQKVNLKLGLNRDLDVDVEFGSNYSEVH